VASGAAAIVLGDGALAALALGLVPVLVQDWGRYAFFAGGRPGWALFSDLIWMAMQSVALAAAAAIGPLGTWGILAAWGAGGFAGAVLALVLLRPRLRLVALLVWLRRTKRLSGGTTAQVLLSQGAGQVAILAISAVAGLDALGGLRAAQLLLSPAALTLAALSPLLLPDLGGNGALDLRRIRRRAGLASALGVSIVVSYFSVVLLWPGAFTLVFGERFGRYGGLVPLAGLAALAQGLAVGPGLGVRALREGRAVFLTQAAAVTVGMPVTIAAAARWGATGAAAGLAAQSGALCLASWLTYLGAVRRVEQRC
jgi:O-antigen/teichoic acid export membrane protein